MTCLVRLYVSGDVDSGFVEPTVPGYTTQIETEDRVTFRIDGKVDILGYFIEQDGKVVFSKKFVGGPYMFPDCVGSTMNIVGVRTEE